MDAYAVLTLISSDRHVAAVTRHSLTLIRQLISSRQIHFSHIFREGNKPADFLARRGLSSSELLTFDESSAPRYLRGLIRMDQLGYPSFRIRPA